MTNETPVFSEEGIRELNGFRLYAKMSGVYGSRAETFWKTMPENIKERWRLLAAERNTVPTA